MYTLSIVKARTTIINKGEKSITTKEGHNNKKKKKNAKKIKKILFYKDNEQSRKTIWLFDRKAVGVF